MTENDDKKHAMLNTANNLFHAARNFAPTFRVTEHLTAGHLQYVSASMHVSLSRCADRSACEICNAYDHDRAQDLARIGALALDHVIIEGLLALPMEEKIVANISAATILGTMSLQHARLCDAEKCRICARWATWMFSALERALSADPTDNERARCPLCSEPEPTQSTRDDPAHRLT